MAQISTFTSDAQNFDPVAARATLNTVRTRLLGSKTIRAQDIRDIINVYNAWLQHKHVVYDNYYVAYGNKYAYATQGANTATEVPVLPTQITKGLAAAWGSPGVYDYLVPANVTTATIELAGGGGGGGGSSVHTGQDAGPGAGGGSGNYLKLEDITLTPGSTLRVTIGAGGIGGNYAARAPGYAGAKGGTTSIDLISGGTTTRLWTAPGGDGGQGCVGWPGSGNWGNSGRPAAKGGVGGGVVYAQSAFEYKYVSPGETYWVDKHHNGGIFVNSFAVWKKGTDEEQIANSNPTASGFKRGTYKKATPTYDYNTETYIEYLYYTVSAAVPTYPSGIGYRGNNSGAGDGKWVSSYQAGNGGGVGGAAVANTKGGDGVNGYVGAIQTANRWKNTWYQNQGAGGGGCAGNGVGMNGGLGGGGGGGSFSEIKAGDGGNGYVGIYVPGAGATAAGFPNIAVGSNIILDDIRNLMALVNAIRSHLHKTNDGYL